MKFSYSASDVNKADSARRNCFLIANGLGGYMSLSSVFSAPRCDQGLLVAAVKAPNERINMVHRISERLELGGESFCLSDQCFADGAADEDGSRYLVSYTYEYVPVWRYAAGGVSVTRRCAMRYGENTAAVSYEISNPTGQPCTLSVQPYFKFAPKEEALTKAKSFSCEGDSVLADGYRLNIRTDGGIRVVEPQWQTLSYPEDAKDGRPDRGMAGACCRIEKTITPYTDASLELVFTTQGDAPGAGAIITECIDRLKAIEQACPVDDATARQLAMAADAYIVRRDSTGGKTIIAGYPLFSDWGRDTMIALPGCTLTTGRYEDAKSILGTFLAYEKDGLVPNLFPEGGQAPMYNTVDAALLLIDCVWQYVLCTGDTHFAREAWPVMERIISCYKKGTRHAIGMDGDGLIFAGQGLDQVTWMDVCVDGVLPTPRHGKPVEINAYWYSALCVMASLAAWLGCDGAEYEELAARVKRSFREKFYIPEKGYLRDVLSGTGADEQIRCNQIWAIAMPFTMLTPEEEARVLETVTRHLYTPCGLRTLSPEDGQYHPFYGGTQFDRDMAYHQGTTWVFPMGAYYRACLKVGGGAPEMVMAVKEQLSNLVPMLYEGCAGQLPEIYDGHAPCEGKGCFAQAWSVGEMLRVYEAIDSLERRNSLSHAQ